LRLDLRQVYGVYTISHSEISRAIPGPCNLLMVILVFLLDFIGVFFACNHPRLFLNLSIISVKFTVSWGQKWVVGLDWNHIDRCFVSIHIEIVFLIFIPYDIIIAHLLQLILHLQHFLLLIFDPDTLQIYIILLVLLQLHYNFIGLLYRMVLVEWVTVVRDQLFGTFLDLNVELRRPLKSMARVFCVEKGIHHSRGFCSDAWVRNVWGH
jgi:hypothetical protein